VRRRRAHREEPMSDHGAALAPPPPPRPATGAGEPGVREAAPWGRFAWIVVQVAIAIALLAAFRIESPAFYGKLGPLILVGFIAHHLMPMAHRLPFFAALSLGGTGLVFGLVGGAWLVGVGLALIALCHLPVAFRTRVVLVMAAAALLAAMRAGWIPAPWPGAIWPILGSMFMFRMIAYLYDLSHTRQPVGRARTLGYFFLLPNVCFPLFPVVDFNTFRRTYYDRAALEIYEEGVRWMLRGVTQLLLYRVVYQYATISPADIATTADLVRYLLANFGLYLRVSGQFHLIVGILHLFGFRLPETHRFFFLAGSFTEFWRRINIYWKDFMQKVVFTPVLFALRKRALGERTTLILATVSVFVATWAFHSYQWFWLLGSWLWSATDTAFWAILAVFLVINVLRETRRGRVRSLGTTTPTFGRKLRSALATAVTFTTMAVLWGLWTSPTFGAFFDLFAAVSPRPVDLVVLGGTFAAVMLVAFLALPYAAGMPAGRPPAGRAARAWWRSPMLTAALPLALLWAAGEAPFAGRLKAEARQVVLSMRLGELNRRDAAELQRGYYEQIVGVNRFNGQLWDVYAKRDRPGSTLNELGVLRWTEGVLHSELEPFMSVSFQGRALHTNRWGMRDRDYSEERAANSLRVALLGQSYVMGMGVNDGETFETLVEGRLNAERRGQPFDRYEILNFAVPRYSLFQQLLIMENGRIPAFAPDVLMLVGHAVDFERVVDYLHVELIRGVVPQDEGVRSALHAAGVTAETSNEEAQRLMKPYARDIVGWALGRIHAVSLEHGMRPVFALIPMPQDGVLMKDAPVLLEMARAAGFEVIDLSDVYDGHDERALTVAEWDRHPNALGHELIADRIYQVVVGWPDLVTPAAEGRR
jgi:D-alanyl-lipoteichoic acid acyltransferase DltB (MBOAT superfamily)